MTNSQRAEHVSTNFGEIPDYVPPHLRGKVWDFKEEDDGTVSFAHPEASMGLSPDRSRAKLTQEQYRQTFSPAYRLINMADSMKGQYAPMERFDSQNSFDLNAGIAKYLNKAIDWGTSSAGKTVGSAGLLSALGGGVGSYLWDQKRGAESSSNRALLMALLAGVAGSAGTAMMQNQRQRRENYIKKMASMDVATSLIRILENDPTLSYADRAQILNALARASNSDRENLYSLLRTAAGAGVGILAARFLGAKGLLPQLAGGIIGGALASRGKKPDLIRNAQGQVSIRNYM